MASKKDLIEAQGFSRRRLLTAFTAGAPGGKELEPAKPMRAVVAGIALATLVVVGGIFYGLFKPGLPTGWETNRLILVSDTGSRYFTQDEELFPVINTTSARLLVPDGDLTVISTDSGSLADIPVGPSIGIVGAPDDVPAATDLVNVGWTACPAPAGTALTLAGDASPAPVGTGIVVMNGGKTFVVSGGYSYAVDPVGNATVDSLLREVGLVEATATEVESRWLNLFDKGAPLAPVTVASEGVTVPGTNLRVGEVVTPQGGPERFLVTPAGELASLTPLAYQLYLLGSGKNMGAAREVAPGDLLGRDTATDPGFGQHWPIDKLTAVAAGSAPCALLEQGDTASTALALAPSAPESGGIAVPAHGGALVAAGAADGNSVFQVLLVDESGTAYPIAGTDDEVLVRLGYAPADVSPVPSAWMQFFAAGPDLSVAAAGSTPQGNVVVTGDASEPSSAEPATASAASFPAGSLGSPLAVDAVEAGGQCEPGTVVFDPDSPQALKSLQQDRAATIATGAGVTVAVVDSGIDAQNAHLQGVVVDGVNLVGDDQDAKGMTDLMGHGTAIAGVIAAQAVDGSGVVGVAPDAKLLSVRVYRGTDKDSVEAGHGPANAKVAEGIRWAVDHGATIVNVSLSGDLDDQDLRAAVEYADAQGVLVVASAGNRNTTDVKLDSARYPAAYPQALAVTALDNEARPTVDSIHGSHVEVGAPGQSVLTATTGGGDCLYNDTEASSSYATAYASGASALLAQAWANETPGQWQYRLMASASRGNPDARDDLVGWGAIQPYDAMVMVPGDDVRGPASPVMQQAALTVPPPSVALTSQTVDSPFDDTRAMAITAGIGAAVVLGTLGTLLVYRRRSDVVSEPVEQGDGLLDSMRGESTRIN
ncbi:type VII secretion protein EccB [Demequina aurantiaca]|uniref:type VII secretion protein EccB n=1 Tax=Demequina aurantiaca TaxID=676200 RepID=UPI003D342DE6